ncbi:hypothetical protein SteCoe_17413 [Stentor coeruleus]|uniref:RING-type domain-containing protein n=1 Tax=Stentor coeruleus TaxID=5963 RepID=A0A1R2BZC5_9CILI|nr:hypothetical protein SteCoe_17413 [Stentor coeruleus]
MSCALCPMGGDYPGCNTHIYCRKCKEFIIRNNCLSYEIFYSCQNCLVKFQGLIKEHKAGQIKSYNSSPIISHSPQRVANADLNMSPQKKHSSDSILQENPSMHKSDFDKTIHFSKKEIGQKLSKSAPENDGFLATTTQKPNRKNIQDFVEIERNNLNYRLGQVCITCKSAEIFVTLFCGHAFCYNCLIIIAAINIYNFFIDFQENPLIFRKEFNHKCSEPLCGHIITIPTHFVRECLRNFELHCKKPGLIMAYKNDLYLISKLSDDWLPYFDGFNPIIMYKDS